MNSDGEEQRMDSKVTEEKRNIPQQREMPQRQRQEPTKLQCFGGVGQWFQILCFMNIPVLGFFYMLVLAIRKKTPFQKKTFAIAYILYRLLVLLLSVTILFVLYRVGLSFVDEILKYAGASV